MGVMWPRQSYSPYVSPYIVKIRSSGLAPVVVTSEVFTASPTASKGRPAYMSGCCRSVRILTGGSEGRLIDEICICVVVVCFSFFCFLLTLSPWPGRSIVCEFPEAYPCLCGREFDEHQAGRCPVTARVPPKTRMAVVPRVRVACVVHQPNCAAP